MYAKACLSALGLAAALLPAASVQASIEFSATGTGGQAHLAAKALFDVSGTTWTVTLSNVGGDVMVPADVLTTLFFNVASPVTLTKVSANIATGSSAVFLSPNGNTDFVGTNIGADWHFKSGVSQSPVTASFGIGSVGLDIFSTNDANEGFSTNSEHAVSDIPIKQMDGGLLSKNDNLATGNDQVTGNRAFVKSAAVFVFTANVANYDLANISGVRFQYGTGLSEPRLTAPTPPQDVVTTPELPSSLVWLGLAGIFGYGYKRRAR